MVIFFNKSCLFDLIFDLIIVLFYKSNKFIQKIIFLFLKMIKKLNALFIFLSLSIKLTNELVCSHIFFILEEYQYKDFSIFEMDSILANNEIECLRKCSLKQTCIFIKLYKNKCVLYGDEYISLNNFFKLTRRKYLKVNFDLNKKVFNGIDLSNFFFILLHLKFKT